ncbi:MAG: threonine-phosphate decarboxylase [Spirochaetes bacterium]|nr:threonine-phosphate decarboxylase [Spirochaetota bacterium]
MEHHGGNIYKVGKQFNIKKEDIIDFSANINPLGISETLKKEIIRNFDMLQSYPDPDYSDLRQAIAEYNKTDINNVLAGNGATELIFLFARSLKFKTALIIAPAFIEYAMALSSAGTKIEYFRLEEEEAFTLNVNRLKDKLNRKYDLLVLCNPNNPTGSFTAPEQTEEIIAAAKKAGTIVLLDESFIEFVDRKLTIRNAEAFRKYSNIFILRSLTKFFAIPGLRLGYALAFNKGMAAKIQKCREPWTVNQIADLAGRVLLKDNAYIEETMRIVNEERKYLYNNISGIKWLKAYTTYANFLLVKILNNLTSSELRSQLLMHRLLIRDAANFKYLNNKYVRIAVKDRHDNELLLKQLRIVGE